MREPDAMRRSDRAALTASILATVIAVALGTGLSVLLGGFARGFVALGAFCVAVAAVVLWRPLAIRLLKTRREPALLGARYSYEVAYSARPAMNLWLVVLMAILLVLAGIGFSQIIAGGDSTEAPVVSSERENVPPPREGAEERGEDPSDGGSPGSSPSSDSGYAVEPKDTGQSGAAGGSPSFGGIPGPRNESTLHDASSAKASPSSPLVPILITVAVLAAISVGLVLVRQRRLGRGASTAESRR